MKKTLLATLLTLILALSCAFGLAACNDDNGNDNDDNNPPAGSQTVEVTGVEVDESTWMLEVGKTKQLTATVSPENATDKSVTWISSNPEVASVSSAGLVTGVAPGSNPVTITAKTANNKTATCLVTVVAASTGGDQPGASQTATLTVGFNQLEVSKNGTTCKLTVDITGNYTFTLSTDPDNKFIVTIGTQEPETYENGDIVTLPLNKGVEVEFTIAAHADNKDGNLSLNIVSETKPLGYAGMIQVSSRNNSDAITEGYIEVPVAVLEAGDYTLTGGVTGGTAKVYLGTKQIGASVADPEGEGQIINVNFDVVLAELDANGAIKLKFEFNVTNTAENGFIFWAYVDVDEEEEEEDDYPEITL
ncbi:MAG: Ig-like domain-containing protein, partial [Clostridia bacterium]|nr:Ig-like domain-containing protein [Clostridia bacterium]